MAEQKELPKAYEAALYELALYERWEKSGYFTPENLPGKRKEPFCIVLPPPNRTGTLHVGHAVMAAIEDLMIRFERMRGKKALWIPGTDHAAIATEVKVEQLLAEKGMKDPKKELGREKFLDEVRKFAEDSASRINEQMRRMGSSLDWTREAYTLDEKRNKAVNAMFKMMYEDGLIERGDRIVNWDPRAGTNVSDDEIEWVEEGAPFYYIKYGPFEIGTARPETKFGDKYVVMHPDDERYKGYTDGQKIELEWINGPITATVIKDPVIDMSFGTGVMTITPWHDTVDFELAERHSLDKEQIIDLKGDLLPIAGKFAGTDIRTARKGIVEELKKKGLLVKVDNGYRHRIATNSRGGGVIEPQIMRQWFVRVNKPFKLRQDTLGKWKKGATVALKELMHYAVESGQTKIVPERFDKIYYHWIDNLRDWCISRQIWFGHQIPVWYRTAPEGEGAPHIGDVSPGEGWTRDPDTLDTWFSSGMWTFSTLGWPENIKDLKTYHPTSVLETGYDIIFFWVARMILMSAYALGEVPFRTTYLHGLVRDEQGRKMSKSLGNVIDPLDVSAKYGTDAVRLALIIGTSPGMDTRLSEEKIAGFRNFTNKLWNIGRYISKSQITTTKSQKNSKSKKSVADRWILSRLDKVVEEVTADLAAFRYSTAGEKLRDFTWIEFADWYVEIHKREGNDEVLAEALFTLLKLWHPFMPFVTEALWSELGQEGMLMIADWPESSDRRDEEAEKIMGALQDIVSAIRSIRADYKVAPDKPVDVVIESPLYAEALQPFAPVIKVLARANEVNIAGEIAPPPQAATVSVGTNTVSVPLAELVDLEKEKKRIQDDIVATEKFAASVEGRLGNADFVAKAPAKVIEADKAKLAEAKVKLEKLNAQLKQLG
jgi:valyl-tRNA synthetase